MLATLSFSLGTKKFVLELPPFKVFALILTTFLFFVGLELYLLHAFQQSSRLSLWDLIFWALLIFWSVRLEVRLPLSASVSQLFIFALAFMVLAPPWLVPLWSFLFQPRGDIWYKQLFNRSQDALATALATLTWLFFQKNPLYLGHLNLSAGVGIALSALVFFVVNTFLVTTVIYFSTQTPLREIWRKNFGWVALSYLVLSPLALLLARAYETPLIGNWGGWTVLFFLIPLYYSRYYWDEKVRLEQAFDTTLEVLMNALEAKEQETRFHSERVADIARDLARAHYKNEAKAQEIYRAARLHDIGKIAIPEALLLKPGSLTPEEYALIQSHTTKGVKLLSPAKKVAFDALVYNVILYHHERWDGRGYPERLAGQDIPEEARIVGLADAYEAMTAGRPYRKAKTSEEALKEVQEASGHQFDPKLVQLFTELWHQNPIWRDREAYLAAKEGSVSRSTLPPHSSASDLPSPSEPGQRTSEG
ncbi:Integral membrane protein/HD-hydrolase domain protein [Thermus sp. CCB_US3_UF1]|uniref:HD-GYP domain-containing protein n=2 Tax=unclassified Thermus TaxID=2619321 RepID=UPI000238A209|nr:HD-GYP domain-containing protein [Thermus sp. CCB_US3_UF1]AEV15687.1 Integral membrane protein/HD-hydrolase domain protein [Thermus sp. CCB_US3_UF1]